MLRARCGLDNSKPTDAGSEAQKPEGSAGGPVGFLNGSNSSLSSSSSGGGGGIVSTGTVAKTWRLIPKLDSHFTEVWGFLNKKIVIFLFI